MNKFSAYLHCITYSPLILLHENRRYIHAVRGSRFCTGLPFLFPPTVLAPQAKSPRLSHLLAFIHPHPHAGPNDISWDYAPLHIEERGWPDIPITLVIQDEGAAYQTNAHTSISYHVPNHHTPSIGICLRGNFETHGSSPSQEKSIKRLIAHLRSQMPNKLAIKAHRNFNNTRWLGEQVQIVDYY